MKTSPFTFICVAALCLFNGCASIVSGSRKNVTIDTTPEGAHVSIKDKRGREVASLTTPAVASLKRSDWFFVPARYTATVEKDGYNPVQLKINPTLNAWWMGNAILLPVFPIGFFIIDPATGAMWGLTPSRSNISLIPAVNTSTR